MKRFLIPFFLLVLTSCSFNKYQSKAQANIACNEWVIKGEKLYYISEYESVFIQKLLVGKSYSEMEAQGLGNNVSRKYARSCLEEVETNQYLGLQIKDIDKDMIYSYDETKEIVKNFKY